MSGAITTTAEMACEVCKAFPPHGGGTWFQGVSGRSKWVCVDEHACCAAYAASHANYYRQLGRRS